MINGLYYKSATECADENKNSSKFIYFKVKFFFLFPFLLRSVVQRTWPRHLKGPGAGAQPRGAATWPRTPFPIMPRPTGITWPQPPFWARGSGPSAARGPSLAARGAWRGPSLAATGTRLRGEGKRSQRRALGGRAASTAPPFPMGPRRSPQEPASPIPQPRLNKTNAEPPLAAGRESGIERAPLCGAASPPSKWVQPAAPRPRSPAPRSSATQRPAAFPTKRCFPPGHLQAPQTPLRAPTPVT